MNWLLNCFLVMESQFPNLALFASLAIKTGGIVTIAAVFAWLLRSRSAAARCWVWRCSLAGVFFVLLFSFGPSALSKARLSIKVEENQEAARTFWRGSQAMGIVQSSEDYSRVVRERETTLRAEATPPWLVSDQAQISFNSWGKSPWREIELLLLPLIWGLAKILLVIAAIRVVGGAVWLKKRSCPASADTLAEAEGAGKEMELRRAPRIRMAEKIQSPLVLGVFKPFVYLPHEASAWPSSKRRAVYLHELAHWVRKDNLWQYAGQAAKAIFWWNPLVAAAVGRMSAEAEEAADDVVLLRHCGADAYAKDLIDIASGGKGRSFFAPGVSMIGNNPLERRIKALLSDNPWRGKIGRPVAALILAAMAAFVFGASLYVIREAPAATQGSKDTALTPERLAVLKRAVETNERRLKFQRYLHFKLESVTTETTGGVSKTSPEPQKMEAWVDEWTGQHRADFKPRVSPWSNGAKPFWIANEMQINDGKTLYTTGPHDDIAHPMTRAPEGLEFYLGVQETVSFIQIARNLLAYPDVKRPGLEYDLSEVDYAGARLPRLRERYFNEGKVTQERSFVFDPAKGDMVVLSEIAYPESENRPTRYAVQEIGGDGEASYHPKVYEREYGHGDMYSMTNSRVTEFQVLSSLPAGVTELKAEPPAATGSERNNENGDNKTVAVFVADDKGN